MWCRWSSSIVTPSGAYARDSEHGGFSMTAGDDFAGQVANAIMNGPEWRSTVLFIEHTCGLAPLGVNDAHAYDLSGAFDYGQAPLKPVPTVNRPVPRDDRIGWSQASEDT